MRVFLRVLLRKPKNKDPMPTNNYLPKTISLTDAQSLIQNYKNFISANNIPNPVYAFIIVHADIIHALEVDGEVTASFGRFRGYIGVDEPDGNGWRLLVVPVDINGDDVIPYSNGQAIVYDFNLPCPATCDVNSPLYFNNIS